MSSSSDTSKTFKILTIGESGVGKTCILRRFVENKFLKNHLATIGIDFKTKTLNINNQEIKLKIWDTAGEERFRNITTQYYKGADGIVLIYDVTDDASFEKIRDWMEQILSNTKREDIGLVLLGNKCDMEPRSVTEEQGIKMAEELKVSYFETSALTGQGIKEAFDELTRDIMKRKGVDNGGNDSMDLKKAKKEKKKDGGGCCIII
jgi:small GTP-binding protein